MRAVTYVSGDTWNVNPIALRRVEKLFCKNERAILELELPGQASALTMVPIAAILVAGIKLHFIEDMLNLATRGTRRFFCAAHLSKGEEMGYFQSGSTIVVFGSGALSISENVKEGAQIRVGEPLFRHR